MYQKSIIIFYLLFLVACSNEPKQTPSSFFNPKVVDAIGYTVPEDSVIDPVEIIINENNLTRRTIGKIKSVPTNINIHPVIEPERIKVGTPKVILPGVDTFLIPSVVAAIDSPFLGGMPEVVIAKDAAVKDQNPQNFSSYSKLQGLKHDVIRCMLQDKIGNIWFGTHGGGVSKFDGKSFTHYTEKEGLSNNSIWSIMEDHNGNLWFGTYGGGVSKYDGRSFTHYSQNEGLTNSRVRSIIEDKKGNIWLGTYGGGVSMFDGENFTNYSEKEGLINNYVFSILEDHEGNIWFCTNGGVCKFNGESFTHYTEKEGLSNNSVWAVLEDFKGNLWFGTYGGGVSRFDGSFFTNYTEKEGLANNRVWSILEDQMGNLWFGTDGGVCKFDGKYFTDFTEKEGLSNNSVWSILEDNGGNLWFGTFGGGVSKYNGKIFTNYTENEGLNNNRVLAVCEDHSGNVWLGTSGGGVSKYDGKSFTHYTENDGLISNSIRSILEDKEGNLWFGSMNAGACRFDGKTFTHYTERDGLSNNSVWSMIEDCSGNLWFATTNGVCKFNGKSFMRYTTEQGLSNNSVFTVYEDRNKNLWFGTYGSGLTKFDGKSFVHFSEKDGLSNNTVRSIIEDQKGNLWFGTDGSGISVYDGKSFTYFSEKEGLSNNYIFSLLRDKNNNIWFGTRFGFCSLPTSTYSELLSFIGKKDTKEGAKESFVTNISKRNKEDMFFKTYGYNEGFIGVGVSGGNTLCEDNSGNIWIGSNDRLSVFHPEGDNPDTIPPNVQLTGIELFNEAIPWTLLEQNKDTGIELGNRVRLSNFDFDTTSRWYGYPENLSLAYNNNYLTFCFIGITQLKAEKVKYQYILEGIDANWSAITERTEAPYGNLPHGSYTFKVKAMNSEGYWSKEFQYSFEIRPPWWKTWWFKMTLIIFGILLLFVFIKWRERKLKKDKELLERKVKEQTQELSEKNEALNQQKEEIETQRDEILAQRDLVTIQKDQIIEIHKEVTDSINYAKRIQEALLQINKEAKAILSEYFILYKPKNIVSGDFYWIYKKGDQIVIAVADCTGHGVPGAFMSMLGISYLNEIVRNHETITANHILKHLRENIIDALQQTGTSGEQKDGMDISLLVLNVKTLNCQWSGANNPLYIIKPPVSLSQRPEPAKGEVEDKGVGHISTEPALRKANVLSVTQNIVELKGDKMPIAIYPEMKEFTNHEFILEKGDRVYLFSDGFSDQFGGPKGRKFMYRQFKELLLSVQSNSMSEQLEILEKTFENWRSQSEKSFSQVDDVTVLGINID